MVQSGMTPLAALQTATLNPARYFGLDTSNGSKRPEDGPGAMQATRHAASITAASDSCT
jgi:hypothetical protein